MALAGIQKFIPRTLAAVCVGTVGLWLILPSRMKEIRPRVPGLDQVDNGAAVVVTDLKGKLEKGEGKPADWAGAWPSFRGVNGDGVSVEQVPLATQLKPAGPNKLWSVELGEGYAGPVIRDGRVFLLDYDLNGRADVLRCMSLADGKEIWHRSYSVELTRNHGISRTVPAVNEKYVVSLGPKCDVICAEAATGEFVWGIDLAREYQTTVPPWYAGQCPLLDKDRVIIAPGGKSLMIAVELATGKVIWKTPNPHRWEMTHSSVAPMTFGGKRTYVYCGSGGVVGVSAEDGKILWETSQWRVSMANVPTPIPVGEDRIFLSGGYGAGCMMLQLKEEGGKITASEVFRLKPEVFGAEQQTPILYKDHIYGLTPPSGQLACLDLKGNKVWSSGTKYKFGLGPLMIADEMIILVDDKGVLTLAKASEKGFQLVGQAKVFDDGHEAWGPLALAGGRLLTRDMTRMICLDLRKASNE